MMRGYSPLQYEDDGPIGSKRSSGKNTPSQSPSANNTSQIPASLTPTDKSSIGATGVRSSTKKSTKSSPIARADTAISTDTMAQKDIKAIKTKDKRKRLREDDSVKDTPTKRKCHQTVAEEGASVSVTVKELAVPATPEKSAAPATDKDKSNDLSAQEVKQHPLIFSLDKLARTLAGHIKDLHSMRDAYFTQRMQEWIRNDDITRESTKMAWACYSMENKVCGLKKEIHMRGADVAVKEASRWERDYAGLVETVWVFGRDLQMVKKRMTDQEVKL